MAQATASPRAGGGPSTGAAATPQGLLERAATLVAGSGRDDLVARVDAARERLATPGVRVLVVGEFKQGKSQLVNALVNAPVCPIDDDVATSVPTAVAHGDPARAELVGADGTRRPVPMDALAGAVSEAGNPGNAQNLRSAEVRLPRALLAGGLVLVDTPGVGGLASPHALATLAALGTADAVLLVSDASAEYSEPELDFLRHARRLCPTVACVLTKTDLHPAWRRIADLDRAHLERAGEPVPLLPVSSALRLHAARTSDAELNAESGFPALVRHLKDDVAGRAEALARRSAAHDVLAVTEHLVLAADAELAALTGPDGGAGVVAELEAARERADGLRRRSARWQQTLADGVTDLVADVEHELRGRLRAVGREAEDAIAGTDPGQVWDELRSWVHRQVADAVTDSFVHADERARALAATVAEHFAADSVDAVPDGLAPVVPGQALAAVSRIADVARGELGAGTKVLIGMRGSYGGVLMFGLLTSVAGLGLLNPVSLGAGVLMGVKAYREDREARLARRRADASRAVRKHLDEVAFEVVKECKDRLRAVHRAVRDHYADVADDLHRSLSESVAAAQRAARTDAADRTTRAAAVRAERAEVVALRRAATAVRDAATARAPAPAVP